MSGFSTDDSAVINRKIEIELISPSASIEIDNKYELDRCCEWVKEHKLKHICLQFPDSLLPDSAEITLRLGNRLDVQFYILGDTSYGSCCVDEVAAQHVNADGIIHFGHACLSPTKRLPVLYIFPRLEINASHFVTCFRNEFTDATSSILLLYDVDYQYSIEQIKNNLEPDYSNLVFSELATCPSNQESSYLGRIIRLPNDSTMDDYIIVFIGRDGPTFYNIKITFHCNSLYLYNPETVHLDSCSIENSKFLMKRMHLIQCIKEAQTLGILIGTLGVTNYLGAVDRIKELAKHCGKKCYIIAVGKINVTKLANFPEIDVFVLIACPENSLLESKDFYRPIATPYEVELACNSAKQWNPKFVLEFQQLLPGGREFTSLGEENENIEVSLLSGKMNTVVDLRSDDKRNSSSDAVALRNDGTVSTNFLTGANFLKSRTWQGLQVNLGEGDIALASKGRSGIPSAYDTEVNTLSQKDEEK